MNKLHEQGTIMKSSVSVLTKPKDFCLFCTDLLQKQVPVNFIQYNEFSRSLFGGLSLDAKLSHNLSITLAQVFGHTQNSLLKKSWFSLKMIGIGLIFCSTLQYCLRLMPLLPVTPLSGLFPVPKRVSCNPLEIIGRMTWLMRH